MNISFVKLGHEECEICEEFNLHDPTHNKDNLQENCNDCKRWFIHIEKARISREQYRKDAESIENAVVYCADLQKVIMLPRMDMFKCVIYTRPFCLQ